MLLAHVLNLLPDTKLKISGLMDLAEISRHLSIDSVVCFLLVNFFDDVYRKEAGSVMKLYQGFRR